MPAASVRIYAAGSLKAALTATLAAWAEPAEAEFGASGTLRCRIETGEPAHLFASADLCHPARLEASGCAGPVRTFARNGLCVLARPSWARRSEGPLRAMLDPECRLGTSTPVADPSGDYALALFDRAERVQPGAAARLRAKALRLTGGPCCAKAPAGHNLYAWLLTGDRADLFLTYRTNALLAQSQAPDLRLVELPPELAIEAEYGLTVLARAPAAAGRLADFVLGREGQAILARHGFGAP